MKKSRTLSHQRVNHEKPVKLLRDTSHSNSHKNSHDNHQSSKHSKNKATGHINESDIRSQQVDETHTPHQSQNEETNNPSNEDNSTSSPPETGANEDQTPPTPPNEPQQDDGPSTEPETNDELPSLEEAANFPFDESIYPVVDGIRLVTLSGNIIQDTLALRGEYTLEYAELVRDAYEHLGEVVVGVAVGYENPDLDLADLPPASIAGTTGDDILDGGSFRNEVLQGGEGNDTYHFAPTWLDSYNAVLGQTSNLVLSVEDLPLTLPYIYGYSTPTENSTGGPLKLFIDFGWGNDTITDGQGNDTLDFSEMFGNLKVNLNSTSAAEVIYGNNTINWNNNIIENVIGSRGNDLLIGNDNDNILNGGNPDGSGRDTLIGGGGNDLLLGGKEQTIYQSFEDNFGSDIIEDRGDLSPSSSLWRVDLLDLSNHELEAVQSWSIIDSNADTLLDGLKIDFGSGNTITIRNYFDPTMTEDLSQGAGYIEQILFADNTVITLNNLSPLLSEA